MNISVAGQTFDFICSALLGASLSAAYDLFKVLRLRLKYLTALFDALFCIVAAAALFLFFMTIGGGEIRIYFFVGIFGGSLIYFLTISSAVLKLGFMLADFIKLIIAALMTPIVFMISLVKKILEILRNIFNYSLKWYRIDKTNYNMKKIKVRKVRNVTVSDGGSRLEKKKSRIADKNTDTVVGCLRRG